MLAQVLLWISAAVLVGLCVFLWLDRMAMVTIIDKMPGPHALPIIGNAIPMMCPLGKCFAV